MKRIGITGGIGAGKSVVCHVFEILGIPNYPADQRAKWLQQNNPLLKSEILSLFGSQSYLDDGALNRAFISKIVFNEADKLAALNELVHPAVAKDFEEWCAHYSSKPFILKEAALLFETESYKKLDATILVHADKEVRIARTLKRDPQRSREDVEKIMHQQMDAEKKLQLADFVIYNEGENSLIKQCLTLFHNLKVAP